MRPHDPPCPAFCWRAFLRHGLEEGRIQHLREEADRVAATAGSACVRNLSRRSRLFAELSNSPEWNRWLPPGYRCVRGILFDKIPAENWTVPWHQDTAIAVAKRVDVVGYGPWSLKDGVIHASGRSASPGHRRVLHFEYAPADALAPELQWSEDTPVSGWNRSTSVSN